MHRRRIEKLEELTGIDFSELHREADKAEFLEALARVNTAVEDGSLKFTPEEILFIVRELSFLASPGHYYTDDNGLNVGYFLNLCTCPMMEFMKWHVEEKTTDPRELDPYHYAKEKLETITRYLGGKIEWDL